MTHYNWYIFKSMCLSFLKIFIVNYMSSSVKLNDLVLVLVLYESNGDRLEFFISVRFDSKKLLKRFDFSQKSDTNLTLINKGGIAGIF